MRLIRGVIIMLLVTVYTAALDIPYIEIEEESEDKGSVLSIDHELSRNTLKSKNYVKGIQGGEQDTFSYKGYYELWDNDDIGTQTHFFKGNARYMRSYDILDLGFELTPAGRINRYSDNSDFLASTRIGPSVKLSPLGIPVDFSTGGLFDVWHGDLPTPFNDMVSAGGYEKKPGSYGILGVGDLNKDLVQGFPLRSKVSMHWRYTNSVAGAGADALVFLKKDFDNGARLEVFAADTITGGEQNILSESRGASEYNTTPDHLSNTFKSSAGLYDVGEYFVKPSLGYAFYLNNYLDHEEEVRYFDEQSIQRHTFFGILRTDTSFLFDYKGRMRFDIEKEDRLFRSDFPKSYADIGEEETPYDSLNENLNDININTAEMDHSVGKEFSNGLFLSYLYGVKRESWEYPSFYFTGSDTVENNRDKDKVLQIHTASVSIPYKVIDSLVLRAKYRKNIKSYRRKEKSARNSTEKVYRLETDMAMCLAEELYLNTEASMMAAVTSYHFPDFHIGDPPSYSRNFYFKVSASWIVKAWLRLNTGYIINYSDDGYWNGAEYRRNISSKKDEYYAVESKTTRTKLSFSGDFTMKQNLRISVGGSFQDVYYRMWDSFSRSYVAENFNSGYVTEPYIEFSVPRDKGGYFAGRICRHIDN
ncbi:MAG: hypothetical protein ACOCSE_00890, partial [Chitinivibrionales bacterium]